MAKRVLITGARAAVALDLARDFVAAGWEPHLADSVPAWMARWSNDPAAFHRYPAPRQNGLAFRARIAELVDTFGFELVVPCCEEVFHLAAPALHAALGERLFAPDITTLRRLHDKLAFALACADWGLPAPDSHPIDSAENLVRYRAEIWEWVFKPRFGRFGDRTLVSPSPDALAKIAPTPGAPWMAQRRIVGEEACFYAVAHRGALVAFAAYGSDWRLGGGARYAFEPLEADRSQRLRGIAAGLAGRAGVHGQFSCDVVFDRAGAPFLIECNPRATSGLHLLAGDGGLARAIGDAVEAPHDVPRAGYLAPAMLFFGLPRAMRRGRFGEWWACLTSGKDVIGRRRDRMPLAGALFDAARFFVAGRRHAISTNAATTRDIEWNGEELT